MKTILLIDDCVDYREMTATLLTDAGYDVIEAESPEEAFRVLEHETFDLIVCDLHMPLVRGGTSKPSYEVGVKTIQELRDALPLIPIIAMSNTAPSDLRRIAKFLDPIPAYTKPVHSEQMIEIIDSHMSLRGVYGLIQ